MTDYTKFEGKVSTHTITITDTPQHYTSLGYVDPTVAGFSGDLLDNIVFTLVGKGEAIRTAGIATMTSLFKAKVAADLAEGIAYAAEYSDAAYAIKKFNIRTTTI